MFGESEWCAAFPSSTVSHLLMILIDHAPILLKLQSSHVRPNESFRFENWWLLEEDFQRISSASWDNCFKVFFT